jgi:hypothetical protein
VNLSDLFNKAKFNSGTNVPRLDTPTATLVGVPLVSFAATEVE